MPPRRRQATADDLLNKPPRSKELPIPRGSDVITLSLTAISSKAYDDLIAEHPPTKAQRDEGNSYNPETFPAALISAVVVEPKLTYEQAAQIWTGETWGRGELRDLFINCVDLCSEGLNVPFTLAD